MYQPAKLLLAFVGLAGLTACSPALTVCDGTADPPLVLKVTVYVPDAAVHFAYKVKSDKTGALKS